MIDLKACQGSLVLDGSSQPGQAIQAVIGIRAQRLVGAAPRGVISGSIVL